MRRRDAVALPLLAALSAARARTLRVRRGQSLHEVLARAQDGDTVELDPGEHCGQAALIAHSRLTVRAAEGRAVLLAQGAQVEGKALLVVRGGRIEIEGLEFRGARVPAGNGAGIRFERGRLALRRCGFFDNEMGLLSAGRDDAELDIDDCAFGQAPRHEGMLHHLLYVGRIARLRVRHSHFSGGWRGHLLKSRAAASEILCNRLVDGEEGAASYQIDLPNGGLACVRGNVLGKSARAQNQALVAFGAEGQPHAASQLWFEDNLGVNEGAEPAFFVRHWPERLPADSGLALRNNRFAGPVVDGSWGRPEGGNRLLPATAVLPPLPDPPCAPRCRDA
ncbi:MAG TPA: hypothetical protein PKO45_09910 [Rubrivivax sp.]|nr:hypothetical protein [Burkholderiales bacterium]HNT39420.1 hypothetical protein [Rubrivivax sp.]